MKVRGPIIMQLFSTSLLASEETRYEELRPEVDLAGQSVALRVQWWERLGDTGMWMSEDWSPRAPNIFVATSPRK